jgi:hypothetical protein
MLDAVRAADCWHGIEIVAGLYDETSPDLLINGVVFRMDDR